MNKDERASLRRLTEAASPAPWSHVVWADRTRGNVVQPGLSDIGCWLPEDAAFITAARNALPALLDYVDKLEADIAAFEQLAEERWLRIRELEADMRDALAALDAEAGA